MATLQSARTSPAKASSRQNVTVGKATEIHAQAYKEPSGSLRENIEKPIPESKGTEKAAELPSTHAIDAPQGNIPLSFYATTALDS